MPSIYHPVALLSNFGKVLEQIIFKHTYNHLYSNNLLYKYQSGFRPGHSTTFQLIFFIIFVSPLMKNNINVTVVFCDISNAFDKVWHGDSCLNFAKTVLKVTFMLDCKFLVIKKAKS